MGRIYVVRHGQSGHNAERILQGPRLDGALSRLGCSQADALARALAAEGLDGIFTSPLQRARETAQAVLDACLERHAVQVVPELYEVDYGDLVGRPYDEVRGELEQVLDAWGMGFPDQAFPGGESALVAQHRIRPFALRLRDQAREERLLVVGHGRINRILLATLLDQGLDGLETFRQPNASITELDVDGDGARVVRVDDTTHLGPAPDAFS